MEEIAILEVLRRHVFLIAALSIVAVLAGYGLSFLITQKYEATAVLLVRPEEPIKIEGHDSNKEFSGFPVGQMAAVETASKTYIQIIESPALIGEVVRELHLDQPTPKDEEQSSLFAQAYASIETLFGDVEDYLNDVVALVKYGRLLKEDPFTKAVNNVTKGLLLKSYEDTYVFEIEYSDKNPRTAAAVANATAELFIQFMEKMRKSEAKTASDQLQQELEQSRAQLVKAREALENYKESHRVFLYKQEYDAKLKVISDLEVQLATLDESLAASPGTLAARTYLAKHARLREILDQRRAELSVLPGVERELQLREADVDVAHTTYDTVAKDLKDAEIKHSDILPEARLVSPAVAPELPSRPRRMMIVLASLLSGLVAGIGLALFLEYIDRHVRRIQDVEEALGLKVLATIPPAGNIGLALE